MSQFLRDEVLKNLSITEDVLRRINEDFLEIVAQADKNNQEKNLKLSYVIRFDNKGFRLFDFNSVMKYFQEAHRVERFIFMLESKESIASYKMQGKSIELNFYSKEPNNCSLVVQDDNSDWVDAVFWKIKERLNQYKNSNFIVRNRLVPFIVQLIGVVTGFIVSLLIAIKLSPKLAIENALAFSFVIAFLIFSNCWVFIYDAILKTLNYFWPNISFKEGKSIHWLAKALISTAFVGGFLYLFGRLFSYLVVIFKSILK
jgi:ABC-type sugar transport system permease subunit